MYHFYQPTDFEKAKEIYEKGLAQTTDFAEDRDVLEEWLEILKNEMK
ncbi:hypothetical protein [Trichococcus palustris]|nr:hypothetical protein [Trichococcus palustris]